MRYWLAILAFASGLAFAGIAPGPVFGSGGAIGTSGGGGVTTVFDYSSGFPSADQSQFSGTTSANYPLFSGTTLIVLNGNGTHQAAASWYKTLVDIRSFTTNFTFQIGAQSVTGESVGTGNGSNVGPFTHTLQYGSRPGTITVTAGSITGTDNGSGVISGTGIASGSINYATGALSVTFTSAPANGTAITVAYDAPGYGMAFVIQNDPRGLLAGGDSNGLGYAFYVGQPTGTEVQNSIGIFFNTSAGGPIGRSMTGLYVDGGPFLDNSIYPLQDMAAQGINLYAGDVMSAHLAYDGTTLALDLTDTTSGAKASFDWTVNIPAIVGADTAYVGFTGGSIPANPETVPGWMWDQGVNGRLSVPIFSPSPGAYATSQTVSLSGPSGSTIYYTTNGTPPTTVSSVYSSALTVSSNEVIQAIAVKSGSENSLPAMGNYQVQAPGSPTINFPSGFASASGLMQLVGNASISGSTLKVTDGVNILESGAAWYTAPVNISSFTTVFSLNLGGIQYSQNGIAFVIENPGSSAYNSVNVSFSPSPGASAVSAQLLSGPSGDVSGGDWVAQTVTRNITFSDGETRAATFTNGSPTVTWSTGLSNAVGASATFIAGSETSITGPYLLGEGQSISSGWGYQGIGNSIGVVIDTWGGQVGIAIDGAAPSYTAVTGISLGVNPVQCTLTYDGTTLSLTLKDTVTLATFGPVNWTVNIPGDVGSSTAYVGFTGSAYGASLANEVTNWTM